MYASYSVLPQIDERQSSIQTRQSTSKSKLMCTQVSVHRSRDKLNIMTFLGPPPFLGVCVNCAYPLSCCCCCCWFVAGAYDFVSWASKRGKVLRTWSQVVRPVASFLTISATSSTAIRTCNVESRSRRVTL